jgi:hypothetical protein
MIEGGTPGRGSLGYPRCGVGIGMPDPARHIRTGPSLASQRIHIPLLDMQQMP